MQTKGKTKLRRLGFLNRIVDDSKSDSNYSDNNNWKSQSKDWKSQIIFTFQLNSITLDIFGYTKNLALNLDHKKGLKVNLITI